MRKLLQVMHLVSRLLVDDPVDSHRPIFVVRELRLAIGCGTITLASMTRPHEEPDGVR